MGGAKCVVCVRPGPTTLTPVQFHADQQTTDSAVARERRGARGTSFSKRRASKQASKREREREISRTVLNPSWYVSRYV